MKKFHKVPSPLSVGEVQMMDFYAQASSEREAGSQSGPASQLAFCRDHPGEFNMTENKDLLKLDDPTQTITQGVIKSLTHKKEEAIRQTINSRIGEDWDIEDMRGRLTLIRFEEDKEGWEHYHLDGEPLISFKKPELHPHGDGKVEYQIKASMGVVRHNN